MTLLIFLVRIADEVYALLAVGEVEVVKQPYICFRSIYQKLA